MLGRPVHRCMGENWLRSMIIVKLEQFFFRRETYGFYGGRVERDGGYNCQGMAGVSRALSAIPRCSFITCVEVVDFSHISCHVTATCATRIRIFYCNFTGGLGTAFNVENAPLSPLPLSPLLHIHDAAVSTNSIARGAS